MSRKIKFRAWDGERMLEVLTLGLYEGFVSTPKGSGPIEDYKIMQYIGFKDRNDVKIYSGDIINQDGDIYIVEYGIQGVDAFEGIGWNIWSFTESINADGFRLKKEIEVIGNIYQNKDLLS